MKLPVEFEKKMKNLLGEDFAAYEQHLDDPAYYGIRVNTLKISNSPNGVKTVMISCTQTEQLLKVTMFQNT